MGVKEYKIVVMGTPAVGKLHVVLRFVQGTYILYYEPLEEQTYRKPMEIDGKQYVLVIDYITGSERSMAMRDLCVKTGHGFILVYSINSQSTYDELAPIYEQIVSVRVWCSTD